MRSSVHGAPTGIVATLLLSTVPAAESEKRAACADVTDIAPISAANIAIARVTVVMFVSPPRMERTLRGSSARDVTARYLFGPVSVTRIAEFVPSGQRGTARTKKPASDRLGRRRVPYAKHLLVVTRDARSYRNSVVHSEARSPPGQPEQHEDARDRERGTRGLGQWLDIEARQRVAVDLDEEHPR